MRSSVRVEKPYRAGRAPYNFVPLPDSARWLKEGEEPPRQDRHEKGLLSGELEVTWTAKSDFFIRGMTDYSTYLGRSREEREKHKVTDPFHLHNRLRLPGSSIRGMVRNMVEIIGEAPLDPINDQQMFFRSVASSNNPNEGAMSYEPQAQAYKSRVFRGAENKVEGVQAGYLFGGRDDWKIVPAKRVAGLQCFQTRVVFGEKLAFRNGRERMVKRDLTDEKNLAWLPPQKIWFQHVTGNLVNVSEVLQPGWSPGVKVSTGVISGKVHQWVIPEMGEKVHALPVPAEDVAAYKESGISPELERHKDYVYGERSSGAPCFFIQWRDASGRPHVTFGHTHFLRIPYVHTLASAVPKECARLTGEKRWDLAQAIFGRKGDQNVDGCRGRVFFEDALFESGPPEPVSRLEENVILGTPKPTTYQHYAVQTSENLKPDPSRRDSGAVHWDGDSELRGQGFVRGHKLYWHRVGAPLSSTGAGKERVTTTMKPARAGCEFRQRIRFEGLRAWELGAILTALFLPEGCGHKIGMAKPLGYGSFQCAIRTMRLVEDPTNRYATFLAAPDRLATGMRKCGPEDFGRFTDEFAGWLKSGLTWGTLWGTERMIELRYLLSLAPFDPAIQASWFERTRYLVIERLFAGGRKKNEYDNVADGNGNADLQKRRPLPPASQVMTDVRLPSDAARIPVPNTPGGGGRSRR